MPIKTTKYNKLQSVVIYILFKEKKSNFLNVCAESKNVITNFI